MTQTTSDYSTLIRRKGFRMTPQRQIILDAISEIGGHASPEAIYDKVHQRASAINRATVYRNLDFLCDMRLVVAARIGRTAVYELAGTKPHHHLICRKCNSVSQLETEHVASFFQLVEREQHFRVDMDHLTLFGLCPSCRRSSQR
ncbi:MAG: Fur family transcriptional regulator [Anaerolineales bacterium]